MARLKEEGCQAFEERARLGGGSNLPVQMDEEEDGDGDDEDGD